MEPGGRVAEGREKQIPSKNIAFKILRKKFHTGHTVKISTL